jgi:hypothetical protein
MPALGAGIHVFYASSEDVDGRDKPGHDATRGSRIALRQQRLLTLRGFQYVLPRGGCLSAPAQVVRSDEGANEVGGLAAHRERSAGEGPTGATVITQ